MFEHLVLSNLALAYVGGALIAPATLPFLLRFVRFASARKIAAFLRDPRYWDDPEWRTDAACALLRTLPHSHRHGVKRLVSIAARCERELRAGYVAHHRRQSLVAEFNGEWELLDACLSPTYSERRRITAIVLLRLGEPSSEVGLLIEKGTKRGSSHTACRLVIVRTMSKLLRSSRGETDGEKGALLLV